MSKTNNVPRMMKKILKKSRKSFHGCKNYAKRSNKAKNLRNLRRKRHLLLSRKNRLKMKSLLKMIPQINLKKKNSSHLKRTRGKLEVTVKRKNLKRVRKRKLVRRISK